MKCLHRLRRTRPEDPISSALHRDANSEKLLLDLDDPSAARALRKQCLRWHDSQRDSGGVVDQAVHRQTADALVLVDSGFGAWTKDSVVTAANCDAGSDE